MKKLFTAVALATALAAQAQAPAPAKKAVAPQKDQLQEAMAEAKERGVPLVRCPVVLPGTAQAVCLLPTSELPDVDGTHIRVSSIILPHSTVELYRDVFKAAEKTLQEKGLRLAGSNTDGHAGLIFPKTFEGAGTVRMLPVPGARAGQYTLLSVRGYKASVESNQVTFPQTVVLYLSKP